MKTHAQLVVVGAGIVGCSAAYELTRGGLTDVVVLDRGPLFRTGGSTSHAPGLVFQNNASRTVSKLAQWTVATYRDMSRGGEHCFFPVDSLEVATTPARWSDLHRKVGYARAWGLDTELLSPSETKRLLPLLDERTILGAIRVAGDGLARSVEIAGRLAACAQTGGAEFVGETRVTGFDVRAGRVRAVLTDRGRIETEQVLICGGIWGPLLGRMAGVPIPLQPCAHPYVRSAPLPELADTESIVQPIWRHQDAAMYLWQEGERVGYGSYRHEPQIVDPELIRDDSPAAAELPVDAEMMVAGRREAERLVPALSGRGVSDRVYGLFSFTPDAQSLVGEAPDVRGLWVAEAVWVTHAAGVGRAVAELMLTGTCELDLRELDLHRFGPHAAARSYVRTRGAQQYREVYDVIHPRQQMARPRGLRRPPWYDRQRELGAYFFESNGWERAQWHEANADLPAPPSGTVRTGWNAREWSPIVGREHRATRERAGLFDMSTFTKIEVSGLNALAALERISCTDLDRRVPIGCGRVAYALLLNEGGGIESDVTITRLASDRFLILTGSGSGPRDLARVRLLTRDLPGIEVREVTSAWCGLGLWGPNAPAILAPLVDDADLSEQAFPPYTARELFVGGVPCLALRMSYVGEDGWEIHTRTEYGGALWDVLWEAGRPHGLVAAGGGAMDSLRLERGFRALGTDLRAEFTPHEAGLGFAVSKRKRDYLGFAALRERTPGHRLSCLVLDDPEVVVGKEPILAGDNAVGWVTSANFGYTVGKSIAYGYLPLPLANVGTRLEIEYFGVRHGATVAAEPLYDRKSGQATEVTAVGATAAGGGA
jgi:glycine cleavage system aminomethyltransferase T/glycine/D-amino acid oxidase-like deaminating enzyme